LEQGDTTVEPQPDDGPTAVNTENTPDTGDLIGRDAPDPQPQPVTDPHDPSHVEPAYVAVRVNPTNLIPASSPLEGLPPETAQRINELAAELTQLLRTATGRDDLYLSYETGPLLGPETPLAEPSGTVGTSLPDAPDMTAEANPEGCA
jgi:hypothetical protein